MPNKRIKKILKQTAKQCVFILVPCVDCPRGDTGFVSDLVKRGFLKAVGKKLRVCSLNDPVPPGSDPYWLCFRLTLCNNIILDNDMIIASLLRFVNAYCALPRKTLLDKSRFRKEMDMLGQITARDNLILVLQKDCYCSYHAYPATS